MHRFLTGRESVTESESESSASADRTPPPVYSIKPIYGLTAAILIEVAAIGYAREPAFARCADGQLSMRERVERSVRWGGVFREARWREGVVFNGEERAWEVWKRKVEGEVEGTKVRRRKGGARSRL